ncbi:MAG: aminotransferase class V-fold PLP-dependent enzyme [Chloroflexi bacterium]|nr:aminotransferase class V-fold PLP-dependent enzyme [Chloroflexota bacterium]MCC6892861.1 aminotransferase class V-fold PLP-dependent enzyme [Anaerolineae bacterium]
MLDIEKARRETPGCEQVLHFNNAGAALMPTIVRDTVVNHIDLEMSIGGYEAANRMAEPLAKVYTSTARLLGCAADEIAILESATHAWASAFYAIPFKRGDRILTARAEYGANYVAFMQVAKQRGVEIDVIPVDEYGQVSVETLRGMIDERVKLIAITHIPTNGGLVNPAKAIGQVAREHNILYLLDACQTIGQMALDVADVGCDMLSGTSRKFLRGPRGMGFLYVRRDLIPELEPVTIDHDAAEWVAPDRYELRKDARRFEKWESSIANRLGFGAAVDYAMEWGLDAIWERVGYLASTLRSQLAAFSRVTLQDLGAKKCGIVTFTVDGFAASDIKARLAEQRINVTVSSRGSTMLDMDARGLTDVVRASVHYYNTDAEIERFCAVLTDIGV